MMPPFRSVLTARPLTVCARWSALLPLAVLLSLLPSLLSLSLLSRPVLAQDEFVPTPDHEVQPGVPRGTVTKMPPWESRIFAPTVRDWWVYVPAQFSPDRPAAVMVFQDGHNYVDVKGHWRVPVVFDNLIAKGQMPVTVAIFLSPGHDPSKPEPESPWRVSNRSFEYDSLGDRYARFLLEEILPEVSKQWPLTDDPEQRAICGASSGGICSFTVAWERPDQFRKVLSTIGSFVNLRGGDAYPALIRKTERKPIRVFLEDSSGDLDNRFGHWPLANQQMHAALKYMGYDVRFDYVEGFAHNSKHGGSIFPDALRWLWRKDAHVPETSTKQDLGGDLTLLRLLIEDEGWEPVAEGLNFADGLCSDAAGNFYFSDLRAGQIWKYGVDGSKTKILEAGASGLKFGPDGRLYACQPKEKRVVTFDLSKSGAMTVLAEGVQPNDLIVSPRGLVYFTETGRQQVTLIDPATGTVRAVDTGITAPNGITLSPDGGTLAVSDYRGGNVWAFVVQADGSLTGKEPYMTLRRPIDYDGEFKFNAPPPYKAASGGDGMCSDEQGRFYVATALGIQIFDPTGRECGLLPRLHADKPLVSCILAGPERSYLYIAHGDRLYRRKVQARGAVFTGS